LEKKSQVSKPAEISLLPTLPVPSRSSKNDLAKLKYYQNKDIKSAENNNNRNKWSYAQVSSASIKEVLKIKDSFPELSLKKIEEIHKTINKLRKEKSHFNMTTKKLSKK